jgi:hypothetical protein
MNHEIEEVIIKLKQLGCELFMEGGSLKFRYNGNHKSSMEFVQDLLRKLKILINKRQQGKDVAINMIREHLPPGLVRCSNCDIFNPGIRKGICMKIDLAWNGEQLQLPLTPHPCSSFIRKESAVMTQYKIQDG